MDIVKTLFPTLVSFSFLLFTLYIVTVHEFPNFFTEQTDTFVNKANLIWIDLNGGVIIIHIIVQFGETNGLFITTTIGIIDKRVITGTSA